MIKLINKLSLNLSLSSIFFRFDELKVEFKFVNLCRLKHTNIWLDSACLHPWPRSDLTHTLFNLRQPATLHANLGKGPMMLRAFPLVSHPSLLTAVSSAETPTLCNGLFLCSPCLIPHLSSPLSSFSTLSLKPTSTNSLSSTLRAVPSQKYAYPDPIPQFAESVSMEVFDFYLCIWKAERLDFCWILLGFTGDPEV